MQKRPTSTPEMETDHSIRVTGNQSS